MEFNDSATHVDNLGGKTSFGGFYNGGFVFSPKSKSNDMLTPIVLTAAAAVVLVVMLKRGKK